MKNLFVIYYNEPVMRVFKLFYFHRRILRIIFLHIQSQLLWNCLCKDFNRYTLFSFCKQQQNWIVNIIINNYDRFFRSPDKIRNKFIGIKNLSVKKDPLFWFYASFFNGIAMEYSLQWDTEYDVFIEDFLYGDFPFDLIR